MICQEIIMFSRHIQLFIVFSILTHFCDASQVCKDRRPNYCKNVKNRTFEKLVNKCKDPESKTRKVFCCQTCTEILENLNTFGKPQSMAEYCKDSRIQATGFLFQINIDKAEGAHYEAMTNCAKEFIKQLPFNTITPIMFMPEEVSIAPISALTQQNVSGSNIEIEKFLDDTVSRLKTGDLNQLPWDHEKNHGKQNVWYRIVMRHATPGAAPCRTSCGAAEKF